VFNGPVAVAASDIGRATTLRSLRNPIAGRAQLSYVIGREAGARGPVDVVINVHDVRGRLVRQLRSTREAVGAHDLEWDTRDASGRRMPAGVYYVQLRAGSVERQLKITLVH